METIILNILCLAQNYEAVMILCVQPTELFVCVCVLCMCLDE